MDDDTCEFDLEVLNALKVLGVPGCIASSIRENIYSFADLALARASKYPVESDLVMRSFFAVSVVTYRILLRIFTDYYEDPKNATHWTVTRLNSLILTTTKRPKLGYTPERVLMCILGHYSGLLEKVNQARFFGFQDLMAVTKAGSKLLLRALKIARPIKFPTSQVVQLAMENAMTELTGLSNVVVALDIKTLFMKLTDKAYNVLGKWFALKFGVFVDAFMRVYDYAIGAGSKSDHEIMAMSVVGDALIKGKHETVLNFPRKLKWRSPTGLTIGLEEAGMGIATDRSFGDMTNTIIRPFSATYHPEIGFERFSTSDRTYNMKFGIGNNVCERFFGAFTNMFYCLRHTHNESDPDFLADTVQILLHIWNITRDIEDECYEHYTPLQKFLSNGHLARYAVNPEDRISSDNTAQSRETCHLLAEYFMFYSGDQRYLPPTGKYIARQNIKINIEKLANDDINFLHKVPDL